VRRGSLLNLFSEDDDENKGHPARREDSRCFWFGLLRKHAAFVLPQIRLDSRLFSVISILLMIINLPRFVYLFSKEATL